MDVDSALDMIRRKFSKKRYPSLTLEQVVISPEPLMVPIFPENYQLYLIEGINNDVILSSLVSAGHFFLQQPTHPTFPALARLNACMAHCYSQPNQPSIPEGVGGKWSPSPGSLRSVLTSHSLSLSFQPESCALPPPTTDGTELKSLKWRKAANSVVLNSLTTADTCLCRCPRYVRYEPTS